MLDNGAFSAFTRGKKLEVGKFYDWLDLVLGHPHWAVIPDEIGGDEAAQRAMLATWPFGRELGMPVWHLGLGIDYLLELADDWPRICFGSSAEYWQVGSASWCHRMDEAFNALAKRGRLPWVHGLRMLGMGGERWPLASADSTNVAQNHNRAGCANCMAEKIDAIQCPTEWNLIETQQRMF